MRVLPNGFFLLWQTPPNPVYAGFRPHAKKHESFVCLKVIRLTDSILTCHTSPLVQTSIPHAKAKKTPFKTHSRSVPLTTA